MRLALRRISFAHMRPWSHTPSLSGRSHSLVYTQIAGFGSTSSSTQVTLSRFIQIQQVQRRMNRIRLEYWRTGSPSSLTRHTA